ncbi:Mpp10 protein-domain-containing protein [Lipomyces arxii]|uniref:Mpp10 protein-domain-containing protein n=1 Tax=Lipomyces arxii TaxID=56418 RepID=UPI0034CE7BF6
MSDFQDLRDILSEYPEQLLQPTQSLRESARRSVKVFLDPLARQYSTIFKDGIYLDGLDSMQIWEQTRLVLDGVAEKVLYDKYSGIPDDDETARDDELERIAKRRKLAVVEEDEESSDIASGAITDDFDVNEGSDLELAEGEDDEDDDEDEVEDEEDLDVGSEDEEKLESVGGDDADLGEDLESDDGEALVDAEYASDEDEEVEQDSDMDMDDDFHEDVQEDGIEDGKEVEEAESGEFVKDVYNLNDMFFDIDKFNRQTEDMDHENLDDDEDDEDIDYFADPDELSGSLDKQKITKPVIHDNSNEDSEDYDEDDIEGHFGGMNAAEVSTDNANDIGYEDFFGPRPGSRKDRKPSKPRKKRDLYKGLDNTVDDGALELAMGDLKKDLFADEDSDEKLDEKSLSTYEKLQRRIAAQIEQLEEENVAKKDWALMGEAKSSGRPVNSLLEEDLEFDRGAKPVPVITKDVVESLEEMIRTRIKNYDFDDLPRRLPDSMPDFRPSKLVDVDQSKSSKSLAELYEDEHMQQVDPEGHPKLQDTKLDQAHKEVEELFVNISFKLDALSSWHFTPKPVKSSVSIVANAPAITMEDAQPISMSTENMLAPQEVYIPLNGISKDDKAKEVIGGDGLPVARSEMTRDERKRRRRREKARHTKIEAKRLETRQVKAQNTGSRADVVETLKKGNVTVIGKGGEKRDIEGKLKVDKRGLKGSAGLKL